MWGDPRPTCYSSPVSALPNAINPPFDLERKREFLMRLEHTGALATAARGAGLTVATIVAHRRRDPVFDEEVTEALLIAAERVELEAVRRALDGYEEPVFWQGSQVGSRRRYSDPLTLRLLEGRMPSKYNPRVQHTHSHEHTGGVMLIPTTTSPEDWAAQALEALPKAALPAPEDPEVIEADFTPSPTDPTAELPPDLDLSFLGPDEPTE